MASHEVAEARGAPSREAPAPLASRSYAMLFDVLENVSPAVLVITSLLGAAAVIAWRFRETRSPVSTRKILIPPLGMSTGFSMFIAPGARVPWSWAAFAFFAGAQPCSSSTCDFAPIRPPSARGVTTRSDFGPPRAFLPFADREMDVEMTQGRAVSAAPRESRASILRAMGATAELESSASEDSKYLRAASRSRVSSAMAPAR